MPTITAYGALKTNQLLCMAFSIGMCFFPVKLMEGYKADTFTGMASTAYQFFMGIFGTQILLMAMISASAARAAVPKAVQSVCCLCMGAFWVFFALNDGTLPVRGLLPEAFPPEAIYGNVVLFLSMAGLSFAGWAASGSVKPNFESLKPKGRPATALSVGLVNLGFFALGCTFFTEMFIDMFLPGVVDTLPGAVGTKRNPVGPLQGPVPPIYLIVGNAGKTMLFGIFSALAMCSVGDEDTTYRLLRAYVLHGLFYFGTLARDGVLEHATGWPSPMRTMTVVQVFCALFYMADTFTGMPYKLEKAK